MRPANEMRRYVLTTSLIGWAHTKTDPWTVGVMLFINSTYVAAITLWLFLATQTGLGLMASDCFSEID